MTPLDSVSASTDFEPARRLRLQVAALIAQRLRTQSLTQSAQAKALGIPQPTLSQIMNGKTERLSLELLVRVAARAGLALQVQCKPTRKRLPRSAPSASQRTRHSRVNDAAQAAVFALNARLSPAERIEAFLEHNEWIAALRVAGATAANRL
jgi:predicted XRE-type DNA-binding protein